jgi:hypothetical protein
MSYGDKGLKDKCRRVEETAVEEEAAVEEE